MSCKIAIDALHFMLYKLYLQGGNQPSAGYNSDSLIAGGKSIYIKRIICKIWLQHRFK